MERPELLQGSSPVRLVQGAIAGALLTMVIGFAWGGWTLGSTAQAMADKSAHAAMVAAIAPICVEQFQQQPDAAEKLAEFKKERSWQQATFVEKGGWAIMPGKKAAIPGVTRACADLLEKLEIPQLMG
jgi:hypothetical protein